MVVDGAVGGGIDGVGDIREAHAELRGLITIHFPLNFRHRFLPVHVEVFQPGDIANAR